MVKKKAKKKDGKKKDGKKKDLKKKRMKKRELKKKELKKKKNKNKKSKKKLKKVIIASNSTVQPKARKSKFTDHSSNYNVKLALKKLRSLKSPEELHTFTEGEQRLTITRVIPAAMNRLKK